MKQLTYSAPIILFLLFVVLGLGVLYVDTGIDTGVHSAISNLQSSWGTYFFGSITHIFDTGVFAVLSLFLLFYLYVKRRKQDLWFAGTTLVGGSIMGKIVKESFARDRPIGYIIEESGYSFPSGHAIKVTLFMLALLYVFKDDISSLNARRWFIAGTWILIFLICFSRIYLGVHWLSDVVGGFFFAIGWVSLMVIILGKER